MLSAIRNTVDHFLTKILLILLVLSFAFWGMGDIANGRSAEIAAEVGDEPIYLSEVEQKVAQWKRRFGGQISPEQLAALNLYGLTIQELIDQKLIDLEANRLGLKIDEDTLFELVIENPRFSNEQGEFDTGVFQDMLRQVRLSERDFLEINRKEMTAGLLIDSFTLHPVTSDILTNTLYDAKHRRREIAVGYEPLIATSNIKASPSDADISGYYTMHQSRYRAPDYAAIEMLSITPKQLAEKAEVTRQDVFALYQQRQDSLKVAETRDVNQLLYTSKSNAEEAYGLLKKNDSFEEVKTNTLPTNKGNTLLKDVSKGSLAAGNDTVFTLGLGEFSSPVQSPFGWHIFHIASVKEEHTAQFDDVKDALKDELTQEFINTELINTQESIEDALAGGASLKDAAELTKSNFVTYAPFNREGKGIDNSVIIEGELKNDVIAQSFTLESNETSEFLSAADGTHYVIHITEKIPARQRTLNEVRGQVAGHWKEAEARKESAARTNELAKKAAAGTVANIVKTSQSVTIDRNGVAASSLPVGFIDSPLPEPMIREIFMVQTNGGTTGAYPYKDGYVFAQMKRALPAPDKTAENNKMLFEGLERNVFNETTQEMSDAFLSTLRERFPVSINQAVIQNAQKN